MTNKMRFKINDPMALQVNNLKDAMDIAFGFALDDGVLTDDEVEARFTNLKIGETLIDEDGDEWIRLEDAA
ncbi:hypothetical protein [Stenotrophomonas phage BUCT608]|nr:hypothetical protein [Stenotrophomonas phage BUCT608]QYC97473.1 hypothetical protein [Stenotrophomonas phage BUCT608]